MAPGTSLSLKLPYCASQLLLMSPPVLDSKPF